MTDKRDYYEILGVARDAGKPDLKKAYRKQAINIIRIKIQTIKQLKINLRKRLKPMKF